MKTTLHTLSAVAALLAFSASAQLNPMKERGLEEKDQSGWRLADAPSGRLRITLDEDQLYTLPGTVRLGTGVDAVAVIAQSGGTVRTGGPALSYFTLGSRDSAIRDSYGAYLLHGGRFETDAASASGVRVGGHGLGLWEQSGGEADINRWFSVGGPGGIEGEGVVNLLGGSLTVNRRFRILLADSPGSIGTLNLGTQAGGDADVTTLAFWGAGGFNSLVVGHNPDGRRAVLNLNSGCLTLGGPLLRRAGSVEGIANFNGATLRAGVNLMDLLNASLSEVNLYRGGIILDTQQHTVAVNARIRIPEGHGVYPPGGGLSVPNGGDGYLAPPLVRVETHGGQGRGLSVIAQLDGSRIDRLLVTSPGQNYKPGDILRFRFHGGGAEQPAPSFEYTLGESDLAPNQGGGITKIGSGTLHLTADAMVPAPILVKEGKLVIHNREPLGPITVLPGATLAGTLHPDQVLHNRGRHIPHPFLDPENPLTRPAEPSPVIDDHWSVPPLDTATLDAPLTPLTAPYLQNMSTDRMVVMAEFRDKLPLFVEVTNGRAPPVRVAMQTTPSGGDSYFYRGTLTDLEAGTDYWYRLIDAEGRALTEPANFRTAPVEREDFMFTTLGDIQTTNRGAWEADPWEPAKAMLSHMRERNPRFFLGLGDHAADGDRYDRTRHSFLERVPAKLGSSIPFFIAWGNHDGRRPLDPLRRAVDMPSRFRKDGRPGVASGFGSFAFSYADVFFVALEHYAWYGINDPEKSDLSNSWLDEVLGSPEAQNARFRVVAIHWPTYIDRYIDGNAALRMELAPRLRHYNVELVLSGHMHGYYRGERDGTHFIVNGGGSFLGAYAPLTTDWPHTVYGGFNSVPGQYAVQSAPGVLGPPRPIDGSLFHGYGEITVRGNRMRYQVHGFNADGSYIGILDRVMISSRTE